MGKVFLEDLIVAQQVKKFPASYGNRNFIIVFTGSSPLVPILSQMNPVHIFYAYVI
jgi:hypothetical protein